MASFAIKIKQINLKWSISQAYIKGIWTQINLDFTYLSLTTANFGTINILTVVNFGSVLGLSTFSTIWSFCLFGLISVVQMAFE